MEPSISKFVNCMCCLGIALQFASDSVIVAHLLGLFYDNAFSDLDYDAAVLVGGVFLWNPPFGGNASVGLFY